MRKNKIRFIVILMSISLAGLIGFQIYWVTNTLAIEKDEFNRRAFEALGQVVNKLEKAETVFYLADRTSQIFHNDSAPGIIYREEEQIVKKFRFSDTILSDHKEVFRIKSPGKSRIPFEIDPILSDETKWVINVDPDVFRIAPAQPNFDSMQSRIKWNLDKISRQEEIIQEVIKDVLKPKFDIKSRVSRDQLKSFLDEELKNKGLNLKYDFAVNGDESGQLLFTNTEEKNDLLHTDFKVKLFPNDLFSGNNFLLVYFPDQYNYILRKTWITLSASVFLIGIIMYCFAYAIHTLIKQKKLSEMKNDFINNMTHEFKTPIATVALTCEALSDDDVQKDERLVNRYISVIKDENKRLGQQVEKVLQIASLDKKDYKFNLRELDIHEIIRHAIDNIYIQVKNRGGEIKENLKATETRIVADELHLVNIFYNLLDNANKYSPEPPIIEIATSNSDGGIIIKIKDFGLGISKEHIGKIFEKFFRVPTGNVHDVKGFGLGLSYVKSMVEAHGGKISAESEPGKWSEFKIFLPAKK